MPMSRPSTTPPSGSTARRCAGETYFDCPYYEQLQYVGDTRIQALVAHPTEAPTVLAAGDTGVFRSHDGGAHWDRVGRQGDLPTVWSLAIDPVDGALGVGKRRARAGAHRSNGPIDQPSKAMWCTTIMSTCRSGLIRNNTGRMGGSTARSKSRSGTMARG